MVVNLDSDFIVSRHSAQSNEIRASVPW